MEIKAVVFDVGGTLIDESRQWLMWAQWLDVSFATFMETLSSVIARREHHRRVFEILRPGFDLAKAREERHRAGIPDEFSADDLYPDAADCLARLRERGLRVGIAGNQPQEFERIIRDLHLPADFVASSAGWDVEKPAPGFFQRISRELRLNPASIAYAGDRLDNDILPARAAGMFAVFVKRGPWGIVHARWPEAFQAHVTIEDLKELPNQLR